MAKAASRSWCEYAWNAMYVRVPRTPSTFPSRSATTEASSSWWRTRAIAMRSTSPVTEYTSLMPSRSATAAATSGIRATSASMSTIAVSMVSSGA